MKNVHFMSETVEWETPQEFFDKYNEIYNFNLDVCATKDNAKCGKYFTKEDDGLSKDWEGVCWMNPPYGRPEHPCKSNCKKKKCVERGYHQNEYVAGIEDWMKKAYEESCYTHTTVVCLVPARTDTNWWHEYAMKGEIDFIRGRLKFGSKDAAPFPSAVVVFKGV